MCIIQRKLKYILIIFNTFFYKAFNNTDERKGADGKREQNYSTEEFQNIFKKKKYCNQKHIFKINTIKQNWV